MADEALKRRLMNAALDEAKAAAAAGEVPVGAVVAKDGNICGRGRNRVEASRDPTAHAETEAIREAARALGGWRLGGCEMYVTAEPCAMCAGALVLARVDKVYVGATNPKAGACVSLRDILWDARLNHRVEIEVGVLREACETVMKDFFAALRDAKRADGSGRGGNRE